jgi:hypothetical protein
MSIVDATRLLSEMTEICICSVFVIAFVLNCYAFKGYKLKFRTRISSSIR